MIILKEDADLRLAMMARAAGKSKAAKNMLNRRGKGRPTQVAHGDAYVTVGLFAEAEVEEPHVDKYLACTGVARPPITDPPEVLAEANQRVEALREAAIERGDYVADLTELAKALRKAGKLKSNEPGTGSAAGKSAWKNPAPKSPVSRPHPDRLPAERTPPAHVANDLRKLRRNAQHRDHFKLHHGSLVGQLRKPDPLRRDDIKPRWLRYLTHKPALCWSRYGVVMGQFGSAWSVTPRWKPDDWKVSRRDHTPHVSGSLPTEAYGVGTNKHWPGFSFTIRISRLNPGTDPQYQYAAHLTVEGAMGVCDSVTYTGYGSPRLQDVLQWYVTGSGDEPLQGTKL